MTDTTPPRKVPSRNAEAQRAANAQRDATFFAERKTRDAANLAKPVRLRAMRLAHEAALAQMAPPARKTKKAAAR